MIVGITFEQSHYIDVAYGEILMEEENIFWADFWPIGNTEKKVWANFEQHLRAVFSCF